ncbi:MAG: enoyl-CoA hydratase/isomerase family protein, partial [Gammaproteobacteria bacterium]|nr:enoyl-CoA hydratase/isomerase family protein [Gammaproteobacteria bacterium]
MAYDYELLNVDIDGRCATVTIDNPPINLITLPLYGELATLSAELKGDPNLTVVVMKSADADFFLAHFDVEAILRFPTDTEAELDPQLNDFHLMCERFRTMDKV